MAVLIEGMEMPKDDMKNIMILADGRVFQFSGYGNPKPLGTAIPVPEQYGRLGDLDNLEKGLRHMAKYQYGERQQGILGCCETIRNTPTIVPASKRVE